MPQLPVLAALWVVSPITADADPTNDEKGGVAFIQVSNPHSVPDPGSIAILGISLIGIGLIAKVGARRNRREAQTRRDWLRAARARSAQKKQNSLK